MVRLDYLSSRRSAVVLCVLLDRATKVATQKVSQKVNESTCLKELLDGLTTVLHALSCRKAGDCGHQPGHTASDQAHSDWGQRGVAHWKCRLSL